MLGAPRSALASGSWHLVAPLALRPRYQPAPLSSPDMTPMSHLALATSCSVAGCMSAHIRRVEDRASAMAVVISARWVGACASTQRWQRTAASASRKVGSALAYRPGLPRCLSRWQWVGGTREASRVVRLTSPSRHGVLRATARALQWRCVSQAPICLDFLAGDRRLRPSDLPTHDLEHRVLLVRAEEAESGPK